MIGFYGSRVIAAVKDEEGIEAAAHSEVPAVFLLGGDILGLERQVALLRERGKKVFLHADLAEGIASDMKGIRFIAKRIMPDGLISTRGSLLKYARGEGLLTIQRLFLVDSSSLETGKRMVEASRPDYLEVLPGLVPKAIAYLYANLYKKMDVPIIAGGMITEPEDMAQAVMAGAIAVSTTSRRLWERRYMR
jgi:glycerol uptake operon antiterminator